PRPGHLSPRRIRAQGRPRHVFTWGSRHRGTMTAMSDRSAAQASREDAEHRPGAARTGDVTISSAATSAAADLRPRAANGRFVRTAGAEVDGTHDLPTDRFLDREISWLQFNERVLQLAADETVPLLERARYLAIFA